MIRFVVVATILATAASAPAQASPARIALLVFEPDQARLEQGLIGGLGSGNALERATAARVATVRGGASLLPALKQMIPREESPEVARELVRAIISLGGAGEADFLIEQIKRFGSSLDGVLAEAVARRSGKEALDAYWTHLHKLSGTLDAKFFMLALWSHPDLLTPTAVRLLQSRDERGWRAFLEAAIESELTPDVGVVLAAMGSNNQAIANAAAWFLARYLACEGDTPACRSDIPAVTRDAAIGELSKSDDEAAPAAFTFARELARRVIGIDSPVAPALTSKWFPWLGTDEAKRFLPPGDPRLAKYLNRKEKEALGWTKQVERVASAGDSMTSGTAQPTPKPFTLPTLLPAGLAASLLTELGCRGGWIGLASAAVGMNGIVHAVNLEKIEATAGCRRFLATAARLSLPINTSIASLRVDPYVLLVKGPKGDVCLDEPSVADTVAASRAGQADELEMKAPIVKKRVQPVFSDAARMVMTADRSRSQIVVVQAVISRTGCVREVDLVRQTTLGDLNRAALISVSQWEFEPARLNGVPVETIFNLTVNFKLR